MSQVLNPVPTNFTCRVTPIESIKNLQFDPISSLSEGAEDYSIIPPKHFPWRLILGFPVDFPFFLVVAAIFEVTLGITGVFFVWIL